MVYIVIRCTNTLTVTHTCPKHQDVMPSCLDLSRFPVGLGEKEVHSPLSAPLIHYQHHLGFNLSHPLPGCLSVCSLKAHLHLLLLFSRVYVVVCPRALIVIISTGLVSISLCSCYVPAILFPLHPENCLYDNQCHTSEHPWPVLSCL